MFGRLLSWYIIYTFSGALAPDGILPSAKFTLCPSLAFICSVTARHSSIGRQPNFAALFNEWNTELSQRAPPIFRYRRPSRWASAHILVNYFLSCADTTDIFCVSVPKHQSHFYGRPMEYGRSLYFHPVVSSFFLFMAALRKRAGHYIFTLW